MSVPTTNLTSSATARPGDTTPAPGQGWLARILQDRIVQIGIAAWIVFAVSIPFLARGTLPFDQPDLAGLSYSVRVWSDICKDLPDPVEIKASVMQFFSRSAGSPASRKLSPTEGKGGSQLGGTFARS